MHGRKLAIGALGLVAVLKGAPSPAPALVAVTVHEGTSMSVAVSPDGRTLAVDLQGSIWTLPPRGGQATATHRSLQRRPPARLVAGRQVDHVLFLCRRRL